MVYIGKNGKAASVSSVKVGDAEGKARNVVGGWVGDENGKARRIWSLDRPFWKFTCSDRINLTVSGKNIEIDFGDGTVMDLGNPFSETIPHVFQDAETHQVTIYGVMSYIVVDGEISSIDTPFPKNKIVSFNSTFSDCTSLTSIPAGLFDNCPNVTSFNYTFWGCANLTSIPAGLFDNCPNVTSFNSTFSDCTSLTSIPAGLFDNCPNVTSFNSTFFGCASLTSIPAGLFDNCPNVTDFASAFWGCGAIANAVPELWDTGKWPNVTHHGSCFLNCTHAANYADIPEGWK